MNFNKYKRACLSAVLVASMGVLGGCATSGNPKDPIEGFNRAMFSFNDGLDRAVVKPVAQGYDAVLPTPAKTGVSNFFGNIRDVFIGVNKIAGRKINTGKTNSNIFLPFVSLVAF